MGSIGRGVIQPSSQDHLQIHFADGAVIKRKLNVGNDFVSSALSPVPGIGQTRDGGPGCELQISNIGTAGTADTAAVASGNQGHDPHVDRFQTADGQGLLESQVQQLVEAMASFAPSPMGQTSLGDTYQPLTPVIAATWAWVA